MMPYQNYEIAKSRVREAQAGAEIRRSRREALDRAAVRNHGVIDAVGHGLIAIGSRLVSDHHESDHRRAA